MALKIDNIIDRLKALGFPSDSWERPWMVEILTQQNPSRNRLLKWAMAQLGLLNLEISEIESGLIALGIFRTCDAADIEGTSDYKSQLNFWSKLLRYCEIMKDSSNSMNYHDDVSKRFIDNWITNADAFNCNKHELVLLPADLLKQYRKENDNALDLQCFPITRISSVQHGSNAGEVNTALSCLAETNKDLKKVHEMYLSPWCVENPTSHDSSLANGIENNHKQTSIFTSTMDVVEHVDTLVRDSEDLSAHQFVGKFNSSSVLNLTLKEQTANASFNP